MLKKKVMLSVAVFAALGMASVFSPASAATIVNVGALPPANPYFFLTSGTPTSPSITADFGATITGASTAFDDIFQFTIPQDGTGSGSLSTSFSAASNQLTITDVLINGLSYALQSNSGGQSVTAGGVPIRNGVMNTIEVRGTTSGANTAATYSGTATFAAGVVGVIPEPASWAMMIGGLGLVGAAMRRRRSGLQTA